MRSNSTLRQQQILENMKQFSAYNSKQNPRNNPFLNTKSLFRKTSNSTYQNTVVIKTDTSYQVTGSK